MGNALNSTVTTNNNIQQQRLSSVNEYASKCGVLCSNTMNISDGIIINNANIGGDVTISQTCSGDSKCVMTNQIDNVVNMFISNSTSTDIKNGIAKYLSLDINTNISESDLRVAIQNKVKNSCNFDMTNSFTTKTFQINDSKISGNVSISQSAQNNANCAIGITSSLDAVAKGSLDSKTALNSIDPNLAYIIIAIAIATAIVVSVIVFVIGKYIFPQIPRILETVLPTAAAGGIMKSLFTGGSDSGSNE